MAFGVRKKLKLRRPKHKRRTPAADPPPSFPPWIDLPGDVTANILQRLGPVEILVSAQKVCTTWERVSQEPSLWRVIDRKSFGACQYIFCADFYCRQAVDRSQGELIDINIEYFGSDDLLNYISERSSHLRSLGLACCAGITSKGLIEAVKKFPELKELHLFHMPSIFAAADIETIGISCPMLTSFTFNDRAPRFPIMEVDNSYAFAVAKTMPNLSHLRLIGNRMRNKGLRAILDGCQHLESLDLRRCFYVDLTGDLGERCSEQIKDLKCPSDSCSDYEWVSEVSDGEDDFADYGWNQSSDEGDDNYSIRNHNVHTNPFNFEYLSDSSIWVFHRDEYL